MSGDPVVRAEGEKATGAKSPFRTLYGGSVAGWVVGAAVGAAVVWFVVRVWQRYGAWPFVAGALVAVALVMLVRWWRNPLRGIRY